MMAYKIGNKLLDFPLIQGGMGIGVSLGNLAGHVAREGCMGVISTVQIGYRKKDFYVDTLKCNLEALREEIKKARKISQGKGMIAINIMVAANQYDELLKCALEEGIDAVISGAGLPKGLPKIAEGYDTALAPIVSGGKAAKLIIKTWKKKHNRYPDFIVLEGRGAGGHLGFNVEDLSSDEFALEVVLKEVLDAIRPFEEEAGKKIPVFIAGSIFDGYDIAKYQKLGAFGAQIGTRFIATYECDASEQFSKVICDAKEEDITIVKSPVGMPGRAIRTEFAKKINTLTRIKPKICVNCLKPCNPMTTPYCISEALIAAARGNTKEGLFFSGINAGRINCMYHVSELITEIKKQWEELQ